MDKLRDKLNDKLDDSLAPYWGGGQSPRKLPIALNRRVATTTLTILAPHLQGGHLLGGAANSMGAKERGPLRMGIESQSKHILNIFVHE